MASLKCENVEHINLAWKRVIATKNLVEVDDNCRSITNEKY